MGNIDFSAHPGLAFYIIMLLLSGVLMIGMTFIPGQSNGARIGESVMGACFALYGIYLAFIMGPGGHYFIFFKVFILPIVMVVGAVKSLADRRKNGTAPKAAPRTHPYGVQPVNYAPQPPKQFGQQSYGQQPPYGQQPYGQPQPPQQNGQPQNPFAAPQPQIPQQSQANPYAPTQAVPYPPQTDAR